MYKKTSLLKYCGRDVGLNGVAGRRVISDRLREQYSYEGKDYSVLSQHMDYLVSSGKVTPKDTDLEVLHPPKVRRDPFAPVITERTDWSTDWEVVRAEGSPPWDEE